jgi:putative Mg2+ transporter-C (MgtC) family protein
LDAISELEMVARLAYAALLGGIIGLEREVRGFPAGVRTVALVAMGATLFTEVSSLTAEEDRIAAGIVTGIGFLGAGVIMREGYSIRGITTAATIWSAAAVGMAVGRELYIVAGLTSLLIFILLESRPQVRGASAVMRRRLPGMSDADGQDEETGGRN